MSIELVLAEYIAKDIISFFIELTNRNKQSEIHIKEGISSHINEVVKWSERIQFYGMSTAELTDDCTIDLNLGVIPRKFRSAGTSQTLQSEESLLEDQEHYLLLGDPGSGKTTTLKRVVRKLLFDPAKNNLYQYPIVIRLREMPTSSLYISLAQILGLNYEVVEKKLHRRGLGIDAIVTEYKINNMPIQTVIHKVLNKSKALILLDGLDEVSRNNLDTVKSDIQSLSLNLKGSKIILSSRSGEYAEQLDGFNIIEICPLDEEQIHLIVDKWVSTPQEFMNRLSELPNKDLADRPLFLTQLLFFYRNYGYLPEQPSAIYKKIISLVLEQWDAERKIVRKSKYAGFNPERKMEFLAAISYHLTYKVKTKVFGRKELIEAYLSVYRTFNLPENEAKQVAREIETHTGIIVEAGLERYEFSHLSLQEYLCAYYLVREPFTEHIWEYLKEYPAPVAVAVVLSSNPSNWLASVLIREPSYSKLQQGQLSTFLSRLLAEKPYFSPNSPLGFATLRIIFEFSDSEHIQNLVTRLITLNGIKESIAQCLTWYIVEAELEGNRILLKRRFHFFNYYGFITPEGGSISISLLRSILRQFPTAMYEFQKDTGLITLYNSGELSG